LPSPNAEHSSSLSQRVAVDVEEDVSERFDAMSAGRARHVAGRGTAAAAAGGDSARARLASASDGAFGGESRNRLFSRGDEASPASGGVGAGTGHAPPAWGCVAGADAVGRMRISPTVLACFLTAALPRLLRLARGDTGHSFHAHRTAADNHGTHSR